MAHKRSLSRKIQDYFYDHPIQKNVMTYGWTFIVCVLSAFIFAFGFHAFIAPSASANRLISGGVSGISQTIIAFVELVFGHPISTNNAYEKVYSVLYFGLNVPVFVIAWKGIGKRFAVFTLINVGFVALFTSMFEFIEPFFETIAKYIESNGGLATRALLGGIFTGLSSAIAYKVDSSAGGMDVIAYWIALKKSRLVGKYSVYINAVTISLNTLLALCDHVDWATDAPAKILVATLFSILYLFVTMFIVDTINLRNKKCKIEAVTENKDLGQIIISSLPHGATMLLGKGAFTGHDKFVITMVVSSYEVKQTVKVIREADPNAFIDVFELKGVYGRFYLPPIR